MLPTANKEKKIANKAATPTTPLTTPPAIAPLLIYNKLPEPLDPVFAVDENEGDDEDVAVEVRTGVPKHNNPLIFHAQVPCYAID